MLLIAALAAVLALSGCQVRYDETRRPNARSVALKPDDAPGRLARARRMASDPHAPTVRERRRARALALAQADMYTSGEHHYAYDFDGSASQIDKVSYVAQSGALTIDYEADPCLNEVDGVPQDVRLVVYHLSHTAAFDQLARSEDGLRRLLAEDFDDASVKGVDAHTVIPDDANRLHFNRYQDGRYVALVAGYDGAKPSACVFTTRYGLGRWIKKGKSVLEKRYYMYRPLPMHLAVHLGPQRMSVRNTGRIHEGLAEVHELMHDQVRHFTYEQTFGPALFGKSNPFGIVE